MPRFITGLVVYVAVPSTLVYADGVELSIVVVVHAVEPGSPL